MDRLLQAAFYLLQVNESMLYLMPLIYNAESPAIAGDSDYNNRLERKN